MIVWFQYLEMIDLAATDNGEDVGRLVHDVCQGLRDCISDVHSIEVYMAYDLPRS